jgi:hypothetical protein
MLRSVLAVLAGFMLVAVLDLGGEFAARMIVPDSFDTYGNVSDTGLRWVTLAYSSLFGVLGAFVTARLAPSRPVKHALILGAVLLVIAIWVTVRTWETHPAWYHIVALIFVLPESWLGGVLGAKKGGAANA